MCGATRSRQARPEKAQEVEPRLSTSTDGGGGREGLWACGGAKDADSKELNEEDAEDVPGCVRQQARRVRLQARRVRLQDPRHRVAAGGRARAECVGSV